MNRPIPRLGGLAIFLAVPERTTHYARPALPVSGNLRTREFVCQVQLSCKFFCSHCSPLAVTSRHSLGLWPGPGRRQLWKWSSQNVLRFFCGLSEAAEDSRCNGCPIKSVSERRSERNRMSRSYLQSPAIECLISNHLSDLQSPAGLPVVGRVYHTCQAPLRGPPRQILPRTRRRMYARPLVFAHCSSVRYSLLYFAIYAGVSGALDPLRVVP